MTKLEIIRDSMGGGGNKSTGGRQRKVLSKRNQEDKGANTQTNQTEAKTRKHKE